MTGRSLRAGACLLLALAPIVLTVSSPPGHAATAGLVAAYGFNEGSGTTLTDLSGNGRSGTISGAAWTTAGRYGGALTFSGSATARNWVTIPDHPSLALSGGFTLEAWARPTTLGTPWRTVLIKEQSPPSELTYALYANSDTGVPSQTPSSEGPIESCALRRSSR